MKIPHLRTSTNSLNAVSLAIIGGAIVLMIAGVAYYVQQERQRASIDKQTSRTNQLISEVKALSEENKTLNQENKNYAYCNAVLLAKYTQDHQPIVIEDLNKCLLTSSPEATSQSSSVSPQSSTGSSRTILRTAPAQSSSNNTTQPPAPTTTPQPIPNPVPAPILNLLPCLNIPGIANTCP